MAKLLFFAGLLALACMAQAARLPADALSMLESLPQSMMGMQGAAKQQDSNEDTSAAAQVVGNMMASAAHGDLEMMLATNEHVQKGKGKGSWPIHVATKFLVKPDGHINFVHRWWAYNARSEDEKGLLHHSLSKVAGDNLVWTSYTVYKNVEAAFKHMRSEALRDFGSYLMTANVPVEYTLVFPIHGCHCKDCKKDENGANVNGADCFTADDAAGADLAATPFAAAAAAGADDNKKRGWPVRLVTKYIVPPRDGRDFIKAFGKMAEALEDAKGKLALVLSKPAGDNTVFVSYSAWESYEALGKAARKGAVRDFLKYVTDSDIVVINKKLWRVPSRHP
ncbi:hypothetical protein OEZ85_005156 [Tetradesmus obliquus]|uniref:ABM domain-containing protein n=1 Tax=Tetradesmus obliquus TaxID=3088 RepID=A0ABY8UK94_TETOB|nr:hypothetical protein OEZ85_005156 [Tetradesmus obliquus]